MAATMARRSLTRNFLKSVKYSVPRKIITQQTRLCSYYPINDEFYGLTSEQQQVSYKLSFFNLMLSKMLLFNCRSRSIRSRSVSCVVFVSGYDLWNHILRINTAILPIA